MFEQPVRLFDEQPSGRMNWQALGLPSSRRIYLLSLEEPLYSFKPHAEIFVLFILRLLNHLYELCMCVGERTTSLFE